MVVADEATIREVIAFPKNQRGLDLLFEAPDAVEPGQLEELGLAVEPEKQTDLW